jgi:hypothetical protein
VPNWLDGTRPLPADVRLILLQPRRWQGIVAWLVLGLFFLAWVAIPVFTLVEDWLAGGQSAVYLTFGAVAILAMFSLFLAAVAGQSVQELNWLRAKKGGALRHGLFLGADGLLVRLRREFHLVPYTAVIGLEMVSLPSDRQIAPLVRLIIQGEEERHALTLPPELELSSAEVEKVLREWVGKRDGVL